MGYYGIEAIIYWTANWREFRSEIYGQFGENEVSTITYFFCSPQFHTTQFLFTERLSQVIPSGKPT